MNELIDILHKEQCSCVIGNHAQIHIYRQRGVADLLWLLDNAPDILDGARVADKVVGRGAAALLILGKITEIHADVISQRAFSLLKEYRIPTSYTTIVPHIINRAGTGQCPVETLCRPYHRPEEMLPHIRAFVQQMKAK